MVILNPNAFDDTAEQNDVQELLISALIEQTGDHASGTIKDKWGRILDRWRKHPAERLRLAVFIDGINQRPEKDWARIAEKFASELDQNRRPIDCDRADTVLPRPSSAASFPSFVKRWKFRNGPNRNATGFSGDRGIIATNLQPKVAASLLNPRLLGIALELLEGNDLAGLEEVSVNHLLFEHIRSSDRNASVQQPFEEFVADFGGMPIEVISRVRSSHRDDLNCL